MFKEKIVIPYGMVLVLDDIGWFYGRDLRTENGAARTGMPRRHVLADYEAIENLGRRIGMRISSTFVIGEFDINRRLAKIPTASAAGADWTGSKWYNDAEAHEIRDFINSSKYIDLSLHGLLHGVWYDGAYAAGSEYAPPVRNGAPGTKAAHQPLSADEFRRHIEVFFEIYNDWHFSPVITSFAAPTGHWGAVGLDRFQPVLREYGIKYWSNAEIGKRSPHVNSGVVFNPKSTELVSWETYDVNPDRLPLIPENEVGIISGHWPNILRFDPALNGERVEAWASFFERNANVFGVLKADEISTAHQQQLYRYFGKISENGRTVVIDLSDADAQKPADLYHPIYISLKDDLPMPVCVGGILSLHEKRAGFYTVRVDRTEGVGAITLTF